MEGDERRIRPVDEPRRQSTMLAERQPVPDRIGPALTVSVLPEVAQQVQLEARHVRPSGRQAQQSTRQIVTGARLTAERKWGPKAAQRRVPRVAVQGIEKIYPV